MIKDRKLRNKYYKEYYKKRVADGYVWFSTIIHKDKLEKLREYVETIKHPTN